MQLAVRDSKVKIVCSSPVKKCYFFYFIEYFFTVLRIKNVYCHVLLCKIVVSSVIEVQPKNVEMNHFTSTQRALQTERTNELGG